MDFKDAVAADIDNVFFQTNEFSETILIDGNNVPIIYDTDALQGLSDIYAMGLAEGEQFIFIKEKDMHRLPQPGDLLTKGGKKLYVMHSVSDMGVYGLRIGRDQV
jgi:hypothetical protein